MSLPIRCPKCGRDNAADAVICSGCDFILDTSFLGDDILNDDDALGGDTSDASPPTYGGDALILGKPSTVADEFASFESEQTGDFLTAATSAGVRALSPTMVYIDAETKALLEPDAVLALKDGVDPARLELSPFEQHVLKLIDGNRPVARLGTLSGLTDEDLRICLLLIADKGILRRIGTSTRADAMAYGSGDFDEATSKFGTGIPGHDDDLPDHLAGPTEAAVRPGAMLADDDLRDLDLDDSDASGEPSPFAGGAEAAERPVTLPAEFLTPVVASPPPRAAVPPLPGAAGIPPLPGMGGVPPLPGRAPAVAAAAASSAATTPAKRAPGRAGKLVIRELEPPPAGPPPSAAVPEPTPPPAAATTPSGPRTAAQKKAEGLFDMAIADIRANKMARALGYARMAHELDPADARYRELVEDWGNAKAIVARSDHAPEDVKLYNQAKMAEAEGNIDQAIAALEKAIKVNPRAAALQNQMGVLLATKKKDFSRALTYLFRAVELDSNNAAYKNNLGKVLAMSGNTGPVSPLGGGDDKASRWTKLKGKLF